MVIGIVAHSRVRPLLPGTYRTGRARRHNEAFRARLGIPDLAAQFVEAHGAAVRRGPFKGLRYPPAMVPLIDAPIAKLAGTYEHDLQPHLPSTERMVNVGCAEGFYAVGYARRGASVLAYDVDRVARKWCRRLADHNDVRLEVRGNCCADDLMDVCGAFVLSDCEGAEADIFTREVARALGDSTVLIELHGTVDLIAAAFAETHRLTIVEQTAPPTHPELECLPPQATDELRAEAGRWALLRPGVAAVLG